MASYLLLRSNKESGPYSLQDLVSFGLKPYDLVWVEGKSAAWRYPSEVEELKPYAPGTEEQPYDRFFKKASQEQKEEILEKQPEVQKVVMEEVAVQEKFVPKKSVFVTMPGSRQPAVGQQSIVNESIVGQSVIQQPKVDQSAAWQPQDNLSKYQPKTEPKPEPQPQFQSKSETPVISVTENPEAQIKYSQPLDEIKEMYVKTLQERKNKIARKSFLLANIKKASVIVGLVALGVLTGLILKSNKGENRLSSAQPVQSPVHSAITTDAAQNPALADPKNVTDHSILNESPAVLDEQKQNLTEEKNVQAPAETASRKKLEERILELERQQALQQPPSTKVRKEVSPAKDETNKAMEDVQIPRPVQNDPATGERSRVVRNDNGNISGNAPQEKAMMPKPRKSALANLVSVSSNDYKRVAFGGIRNLELTVVNDSRYVLDKVTVELQYLKPSEEPLKTELVQFHSVSPNGSLTMKIKDTNRGIKVAYRIIDIQSSQEPTTAMSGF